VDLGVITGTHGLRGGLRVKQHNPDSELLSKASELGLRAHDALRVVDVIDVRNTGKGLLMQLADVQSIEAAEALRGAVLCLPRAFLPRLEEGEFYHVDLQGLSVFTADGEPVGEVERVHDYPAAQVLRVRGADGVREVPMREPYLLGVELDQGRVTIDLWHELDVEK
jgi:16S rRNA processing protein RimM